MNPAARMLFELISLEADHPDEAIRWAQAWTEPEWAALVRWNYSEAADLYHHVLRLKRIEAAPIPPAQEFVELLSDTALVVEREATLMEFTGEMSTAPAWLAGISTVEGEVNYRGLSILGGETGVGKSKLATRAALLACANPNTGVIYLCAELDEPTQALYAKQITGLEPPEVRSRFPNFRPVMIPAGCSFERVVEAVLREVPSECSRLIIIADTINTLVEKCQRDHSDYFRLLRQFGIWMLESRIQSAGKIAWLAVSELNKDKQVLGVKLDKWADFVLRFTRGDVKNQVRIDVPKGRYSGSEELGTYFLDWKTCSMEKS